MQRGYKVSWTKNTDNKDQRADMLNHDDVAACKPSWGNKHDKGGWNSNAANWPAIIDNEADRVAIAAFGGEDILAKTEADSVENEMAVFE